MIKREYRCYYEGQQESMYFDHIAKIIKVINPQVSVKFKKVAKLKTLETSSTSVPKLAVFDYDLNKKEFESKVCLCKNSRVLYSNLNFDLWLVLHKEQFQKNVQKNEAYVENVKKDYDLPDNADIKTKENIKKILEQINLNDVKKAIENAKIIMSSKLEKDRIYVKKGFSYYPNPSMSINEFFDELFLDLKI